MDGTTGLATCSFILVLHEGRKVPPPPVFWGKECKLASRSSFDSNPQALGALPNLFQCRFKSSQLFRVRIGKDLSNFGGVFAKNRRDQFFTFWTERYDPDAP